MAYRALYRTYRPKTFDEVSGQDHIVKILKNQIESQRLSHAYIFNGPRGTGKTSVAKIFARTINCRDRQNGSPCGVCETCINDEIDIVEMDAASNNGVENIRDIREKVILLPAVSQYKIYIIDEVHMLSAGAFNALLKTLEEPPAHVIFILATTELRKIPATILSRCQRFDFARLTVQTIFERLKHICCEENIVHDDTGVMQIAACAEGGLRDALSILDQVNSFTGSVNRESVSQSLGGINQEELLELAMGICSYSEKTIFAQLSTLVLRSDPLTVLKELTQLFRDILYLTFFEDLRLKTLYEHWETMMELGNSFGKSALKRAIEILLDAENKIKSASQGDTALILTLMRIITPAAAPENDTARLEKLESELHKLKERGVVQAASIVDAPALVEKPKEVKRIEVKKQDVNAFKDIIKEIEKNYEIYKKPLLSCKCLSFQEGRLELLSQGERIIPDILNSSMFNDIIARIGEELFSQRIVLDIKTTNPQKNEWIDIIEVD